ncbi:hypothetical protein [Ensifer adhaerens]
MGCPRGKASPDQNTKYELFSASGGFCQNPNCNEPLFVSTDTKRIHIGEIAHVFAANEAGPRPPGAMSREERGNFDNLILLCPICHTIIDKAPADYPETEILTWKRNHRERINGLFGAKACETREEVRRQIVPLLAQNEAIHREYNPDLEYSQDPTSGIAFKWQRNMRQRIIPNNRRILAHLDVNRDLATKEEQYAIELFRQHILDLEAKHYTSDLVAGAALPYPTAISDIMS